MTPKAETPTDAADAPKVDPLTRLPERPQFHEWLLEGALRWHSDGIPFSVVIFDVDDFAGINRSLGVMVGDQYLAETARRLGAVLPPNTWLARVGGDEFAVVLPRTSAAEAQGLADDVVELREPIRLAGEDLPWSLSAGISSSDDLVDDPRNMLSMAELGLAEAKSDGRGRSRRFHALQRHRLQVQVQSVEAVTRAIREQEFRFAFQPIWGLRDQRPRAVEALLRWDGGGHRASPSTFIPILDSLGETTRVIFELLPETLDRMRKWRTAVPELRISINLHERAVCDPKFRESLASCVETAGLVPEAVAVEVTEGVALWPEAHHHLRAFTSQGFGVWMDDFGTGWSRLAGFEQLPVQGLKLAREFVFDHSGELRSDIVRAVTEMARSSGKSLLVEGVETAAQLAAVRELGIPYAQGFALGRPMSASEVSGFLARHGEQAQDANRPPLPVQH